MSTPRELNVIPLAVAGEIRPGDSVFEKLLAAMRRAKVELQDGDILVVTHKIISKAEGTVATLASVRPSVRVMRWARRYGVDARLVQLAISQSKRIVRMRRGILITETQHGFVCANNGVDLSNVDGGKTAVLLPHDPDASAETLRRQTRKHLRVSIAVIIADTFGRAWREGLTEVAIGVAGMPVFRDFRNRRDSHGYRLKASVEAVADELACAAGLVCGKLSGTPAAVIRGFRYAPGRGRARQLVRPAKRDLFR